MAAKAPILRRLHGFGGSPDPASAAASEGRVGGGIDDDENAAVVAAAGGGVVDGEIVAVEEKSLAEL